MAVSAHFLLRKAGAGHHVAVAVAGLVQCWGCLLPAGCQTKTGPLI